MTVLDLKRIISITPDEEISILSDEGAIIATFSSFIDFLLDTSYNNYKLSEIFKPIDILTNTVFIWISKPTDE